MWQTVDKLTKKLREAPFHDIIFLQEDERAQQKVRKLASLIKRIAEAAGVDLA